MQTSFYKSGMTTLALLGLVSGAAAPMLMPAPAMAQSTFADVPSGYWAEDFIQALVQRGVIAGFPDGTFRPEAPVTRAQFAAMLRQAYQKDPVRGAVQFVDVSANYWGATAIQNAYGMGFLAGYPGNVFRPEQNIPRVQVLVSLANGLNYTPSSNVNQTLSFFQDASAIPGYAEQSVAAATERQMVVNHPNVQILNPNRVATRAEVAAFLYQSLVSQGQVTSITSPYVVGQTTNPQQPVGVKIPAGTAIPVQYSEAERILLAKDEPEPVPLTLMVAQNIVSNQGQVLIPAGSQVVGQLQATEAGAQFLAQQLQFPNAQPIAFDAVSQLLTETETVRKGATLGAILGGTAAGAGAAAGIAAVTGDRNINALEVLGGAAAGTLASVFLGRDRVDLWTINPNTDLALTLQSDLVLK